MSASLAILTIGIVPMQEVLPLLTEYIDEDNISHHSLLGKLSREEVMAEYAPEAGEDTILTLLNDNQLRVIRSFLSLREYCLHWFPLLLKIIRWGLSFRLRRCCPFRRKNGKFCRNRRYFHWVTPFMIQNKKSLMPGKNYWQKGLMSSCWIV